MLELTKEETAKGLQALELIYLGYALGTSKGKDVLCHRYEYATGPEKGTRCLLPNRIGTFLPGTRLLLAMNPATGSHAPKRYHGLGSIDAAKCLEYQATSRAIYDAFQGAKDKDKKGAYAHLDTCISQLAHAYKWMKPAERAQFLARVVHQIAQP